MRLACLLVLASLAACGSGSDSTGNQQNTACAAIPQGPQPGIVGERTNVKFVDGLASLSVDSKGIRIVLTSFPLEQEQIDRFRRQRAGISWDAPGPVLMFSVIVRHLDRALQEANLYGWVANGYNFTGYSNYPPGVYFSAPGGGIMFLAGEPAIGNKIRFKIDTTQHQRKSDDTLHLYYEGEFTLIDGA